MSEAKRPSATTDPTQYALARTVGILLFEFVCGPLRPLVTEQVPDLQLAAQTLENRTRCQGDVSSNFSISDYFNLGLDGLVFPRNPNIRFRIFYSAGTLFIILANPRRSSQVPQNMISNVGRGMR